MLSRSVLLFVLVSFCDLAALSSALRLEGHPNDVDDDSSRRLNTQSPHIIIARYCDDVAWANGISKMKLFPYTIMQAKGAVCEHNYMGMPSSPVEMRSNKGHEASAYLQFLITHYDSLPEIMIFTHGHNKAYHQDYGMGTIITERLKLLEDMKLDYLTLNNFFGHEGLELKTNYTVNGVSHNGAPVEGVQGDFFATAIRPFYATSDEYQNVVLDNGKCAQFIIKRELIRRIPIHIFEVWMQWLDKGHDTENKSDEWGNYHTGRAFEFWWPFILNPDNLKINRQHGTDANNISTNRESPAIPHLYEDSSYMSYVNEFIQAHRRLADAKHVKDRRT